MAFTTTLFIRGNVRDVRFHPPGAAFSQQYPGKHGVTGRIDSDLALWRNHESGQLEDEHMAKTAGWAVPDGNQKAPEGSTSRETNNPAEAETRAGVRSLRGIFARSICRANELASIQDRAACDDGVPCPRLSECLAQADMTIRYLERRKFRKFDP